jgi:hypothetical protein
METGKTKGKAFTEERNRIDPTFVEDIQRSEQAVWDACRWISDKFGIDVQKPPLQIRESIQEMYSAGDNGDIMSIWPIEVKHREDHDFSSVADYPFPLMLLSKVRAFEQKRVKPIMFLIVNRSRTGLISYNLRDIQNHLVVETIKNPRTGLPCECLLCPKELGTYHAFEWLHTQET